MIKNAQNADMEQALTNASPSARDRRRRMNTGRAYQGGQALSPRVKFSIVGGALGEQIPNVAQYDVKQAEIAFLAGATAAMLSKTGAVSYVGGLEIPSIVNAGKEFPATARAIIKPDIKPPRPMPATSTMSPIEGGDACRDFPGRRHPLPHSQSRLHNADKPRRKKNIIQAVTDRCSCCPSMSPIR